jgi:hypothetical protein
MWGEGGRRRLLRARLASPYMFRARPAAAPCAHATTTHLHLSARRGSGPLPFPHDLTLQAQLPIRLGPLQVLVEQRLQLHWMGLPPPSLTIRLLLL